MNKCEYRRPSKHIHVLCVRVIVNAGVQCKEDNIQGEQDDAECDWDGAADPEEVPSSATTKNRFRDISLVPLACFSLSLNLSDVRCA